MRGSLDARLGWYILLGTVPIGIFGLAFKDQIENGARDLYLIGTTLIVLGLLLLATTARRPVTPERQGRGGAAAVVRTVLRPLAATGAQPLTVYTAHVLITAPLFTVYRLSDPTAAYGIPLVHLVVAVVLTLLYATLWQRFVGRGPLERAVGALSRPWAWSTGTRS